MDLQQMDANVAVLTETLQDLIDAGRLKVTAEGVTLETGDITLDTEAITGVGAAARGLDDVQTSVDAVAAAVAAQGAGQLAKEAGGNLATLAAAVATLKAATDLLVAAAGGGYIRQDSTATIAKETGGNLASILAKIAATPALAGEAEFAADLIITALGSPLQTGNAVLAAIARSDYVISAAAKFELTGQTQVLHDQVGGAFPADLLRLIFIPGAANSGKVKMAINAAATADSAEVLAMSLPFTSTVADTIQVIGTEDDTLTVLTCIARA